MQTGDDVERSFGPGGLKSVKVQVWLTRLFSEFIGTFTISFVGAGLRHLIGTNTLILIAALSSLPFPFSGLALPIANSVEIIGLMVIGLAIGFTQFGMSSIFGYTSGGHFNPAISFLIWLMSIGTLDGEVIGLVFLHVMFYVAVQLGGAALAGWTLYGLVSAFGPVIVPAPVPPFNDVRAFFVELLISFVFAFVWLKTSVLAVNTPGKPYTFSRWSALEVGLTTAAMSMVGARVSVGVINPASHFASAVAGGFNASRDWPYYAAPFSSVVIVAIIYATVYSRNSPTVKTDSASNNNRVQSYINPSIIPKYNYHQNIPVKYK